MPTLTATEIQQGLAHLEHQFMTPQIWQENAVRVSRPAGAEWTEEEVIPASWETSDDTVLERLGPRWWAMLSASGYLDRTDPADFDTAEDAEAYLVEFYADDIADCPDCTEEEN